MLTATVRALYSVPDRDRGGTGTAGGPPPASATGPRPHQPIHQLVPDATGPVGVRRPPTGSEYAQLPTDHYDITGVALGTWHHEGLAPVADLAVDVCAAEPRGLIRALKDLYDNNVEVSIAGRTVEAWAGATGGFGKRALVVEMTGGVDGAPESDEARRLVAGLLFKDDDITYDLARTGAETPADLNAPIGSEIFVWDGQTLIWRMHPVARERHGESFAKVTATVVACRQAVDELLGDVRALRETPRDQSDIRLASIAQAQASLERDIQARLDLLATSVGRPAAAHLAAMVRQTGLADRIDSLADLLARSQRTIELELALRDRQLSAQAAASTADVRTVVVVFAVVSVLLSIASLVMELSGLPEPDDARVPRLPTAVAVAALVSLGAGAIAMAVLRAAKVKLRAERAASVRAVTIVVAVVGCIGLVWVAVAAQLWLLLLALGFVLAATVLVAWQLRLAADD